jgi:hypothetical protein
MFQIDEQTLKTSASAGAFGAELAGSYGQASPYPHICIDNFLPASLADAVLQSFPTAGTPTDSSYNRPQERLKQAFVPEQMADFPRQVFYAFNSVPFVKFLESMTDRCVIFNTTSTSYHGNPTPVNHPRGVSRKSIALYYYTATWDRLKKKHTTQFQARPGTADAKDYSVRFKEALLDCTPPILQRAILKARDAVRRGH